MRRVGGTIPQTLLPRLHIYEHILFRNKEPRFQRHKNSSKVVWGVVATYPEEAIPCHGRQGEERKPQRNFCQPQRQQRHPTRSGGVSVHLKSLQPRWVWGYRFKERFCHECFRKVCQPENARILWFFPRRASQCNFNDNFKHVVPCGKPRRERSYQAFLSDDSESVRGWRVCVKREMASGCGRRQLVCWFL